jgi:hypothetical protein
VHSYTFTHASDFLALDETAGKLLWPLSTGGKIHANPVSYASDGKQQYAFGLE